MIRAVQKITKSPLNPLRWCLELVCGHDVWVTSTKKPKKTTAFCDKCSNSRPS